jgi:hypothetical protein
MNVGSGGANPHSDSCLEYTPGAAPALWPGLAGARTQRDKMHTVYKPRILMDTLFYGPGIRGTQVKSSMRMKKMQESSK